MNNEEKILALLEQMNGRLDKLEQGQVALEHGQEALKRGQISLEKGQVALERKMDRRFDKVDANLKALWHDVDYALDKIDEHEKKFHSVG